MEIEIVNNQNGAHQVRQFNTMILISVENIIHNVAEQFSNEHKNGPPKMIETQLIYGFLTMAKYTHSSECDAVWQ